MLLLRCSREADSMSRSTSFCPSTMATRSSSCWVALNNMRFTYFSPARAGAPSFSRSGSPSGYFLLRKSHLRALHLRSLQRVSDLTPGSGPARGRTGGGLQGPARGSLPSTSCGPCASQLEARPRIIIKMKDLSKPQVTWLEVGEEGETQRIDNFLLRGLKGVPKRHVYRVLRSGEVRVNSGRVKADYRLKLGDKVRVPPVRVSSPNARSPARLFEHPIVLEDASLLV